MIFVIALALIIGVFLFLVPDPRICQCGDDGHPHPYTNTCSVCGRDR